MKNDKSLSRRERQIMDIVYEMNVAAAELAREAADSWTEKTPEKPRFVGAHHATEVVLPQQGAAGCGTQRTAQSSTRSIPPLPTLVR